MTEIDYDGEKKTSSPAIMLGLFAAYLSPACLGSGVHPNMEHLWPDIYHAGGTSLTTSGSVMLEYGHIPDMFEEEVGSFFAHLLASQEPLGAEFERVLHENLWDLYES